LSNQRRPTLMTDPITIRDLRILRNGKGYKLTGLGQPEAVKPAEALQLLESLLRVLPEVTDGIRSSWELRSTPYLKIRRFFGVVEKAVKISGYQAEVWLVDDPINLRTRLCATQRAAHIEAEAMYGARLEIRDSFDCPGSREKAEKTRKITALHALAAAEGLSIPEWIKAHAGEKITI